MPDVMSLISGLFMLVALTLIVGLVCTFPTWLLGRHATSSQATGADATPSWVTLGVSSPWVLRVLWFFASGLALFGIMVLMSGFALVGGPAALIGIPLAHLLAFGIGRLDGHRAIGRKDQTRYALGGVQDQPAPPPAQAPPLHYAPPPSGAGMPGYPSHLGPATVPIPPTAPYPPMGGPRPAAHWDESARSAHQGPSGFPQGDPGTEEYPLAQPVEDPDDPRPSST